MAGLNAALQAAALERHLCMRSLEESGEGEDPSQNIEPDVIQDEASSNGDESEPDTNWCGVIDKPYSSMWCRSRDEYVGGRVLRHLCNAAGGAVPGRYLFFLRLMQPWLGGFQDAGRRIDSQGRNEHRQNLLLQSHSCS